MRELYSLWEDFREDYRHNPSFGSIILEDLYTSSGRIIILPIGRYLHVLTFLSGTLSGWVTIAKAALLFIAVSPTAGLHTVTNRDACVTCHTSVTDFRPKSGNPMEVTLMTSPKLYIVSHAKRTDFP